MSGLRIEDIAALLGGLGAPKARADRSEVDFKLARDVTNQAVLLLVGQKIGAEAIFAAMSASLANVLAAYIKPEGVDRVIDQLARTLKENVHSKQSALAGLGFPTKAKAEAEPAKAEPAEATAPASAPTTKPAPAASDWIEWHGGECPVDPYTDVEAKLRYNGRQICAARIFRWDHIGSGGDIVAYRVL